MANKERTLVVSDGDDQRATQANHEVRHSEAEDKSVHGLEERRIPHHHGYDETIVKNWQHCVDEHEERKYTVAHSREDGGRHSHHLGVDGWMRAGAPRRAVAVHGAQMKSSFDETTETESADTLLSSSHGSVIDLIIFDPR